jgi:hypothetical protein
MKAPHRSRLSGVAHTSPPSDDPRASPHYRSFSSKATVWRGALASCSVRRIVAMWPRSYSSRWWSPSWHWRSGRDAGRRCDGAIRCWASTARPRRRPRLALGHQRRHRGLVRPVAAVRLAHRVPENHAGRGLSRARVRWRCRSRPRIVHRHERSAAARVLASPLAEHWEDDEPQGCPTYSRQRCVAREVPALALSMHLDTVAVMPRHQQPLLLSLVQANVAEFTRRMLAPHEDPASAGTRLELVPLLHPWKAVACHAEGRGFASLQPLPRSHRCPSCFCAFQLARLTALGGLFSLGWQSSSEAHRGFRQG